MPPKGIFGIGKLSVFKDGVKIADIGSGVVTNEAAPLPDCEYYGGFDLSSGNDFSCEMKIDMPSIYKRLVGIYYRTKSSRIKKKQKTRISKECGILYEWLGLKYIL